MESRKLNTDCAKYKTYDYFLYSIMLPPEIIDIIFKYLDHNTKLTFRRLHRRFTKQLIFKWHIASYSEHDSWGKHERLLDCLIQVIRAQRDSDNIDVGYTWKGEKLWTVADTIEAFY